MVQQVFNNILDVVRARYGKRGRVATHSLETHIEGLETRFVPAALCDLTPTLLEVSSLNAGEVTTVQTEIQNLQQSRAKAFRVEFRLSTDATIDDQDVLLKTIRVRKLGGGDSRQWEQLVRIPAGLAGGRYYVGIVVDSKQRVRETDETNNSRVIDSPVSVLATSISGEVSFENSKRAVSIVPLGDSSPPIDFSKTTWLVIHGRNGSAHDVDLVQLATVIDEYQTGDQVLMLDWSMAAASGALGGNGENYIKPVAEWAATALENYGFTGKQLNLVGYSWGSYVGAELAEQLGMVNSQLSIEAARDYPGGTYNPETPGEVNFAEHAEHSWAFFDAADIFGTPLTASTADEAFLSFGSDHFRAVKLVTDILNPPQAGPIANVIPLSRLLTGVPNANWEQKTYDATGTLVEAGALFDAVIQTTSNGTQGESLRYFDGQQEQTVVV